jgi:hypothetical protein
MRILRVLDDPVRQSVRPISRQLRDTCQSCKNNAADNLIRLVFKSRLEAVKRLPRLHENDKTHELVLHLKLPFHLHPPEHDSPLLSRGTRLRALANQDVQEVL